MFCRMKILDSVAAISLQRRHMFASTLRKQENSSLLRDKCISQGLSIKAKHRPLQALEAVPLKGQSHVMFHALFDKMNS